MNTTGSDGSELYIPPKCTEKSLKISGHEPVSQPFTFWLLPSVEGSHSNDVVVANTGVIGQDERR